MLSPSSAPGADASRLAPGQPPPDDFAQLLAEIDSFARHSFHQQRLGGHLTKADFRLLARLERIEGCSQSKLAEALNVERATVSRQILALAAHGLVERRPHPSDRRSFTLHLGPQANARLAQSRAALSLRSEHALRRLSPGEKAQLLRLLRVVLATLAEDAS